MANSDSPTATWCCEKLISHSEILQAETAGSNLVRLQVKDLDTEVAVATISQKKVYLTSVPSFDHEDPYDFLLNIPKNAYFDGEVLEFAEGVPFGIGGLGDLYVAANEKEFREYIPKEARFILRGLRQHTAVSHVARANNRSYVIQRYTGNPITVLALNDYDLSADAIRSGIDTYGDCDYVLASNPNCRISDAASDVARYTGKQVLMWGQLLGVLNSA